MHPGSPGGQSRPGHPGCTRGHGSRPVLALVGSGAQPWVSWGLRHPGLLGALRRATRSQVRTRQCRSGRRTACPGLPGGVHIAAGERTRRGAHSSRCALVRGCALPGQRHSSATNSRGRTRSGAPWVSWGRGPPSPSGAHSSGCALTEVRTRRGAHSARGVHSSWLYLSVSLAQAREAVQSAGLRGSGPSSARSRPRSPGWSTQALAARSAGANSTGVQPEGFAHPPGSNFPHGTPFARAFRSQNSRMPALVDPLGHEDPPLPIPQGRWR